MSKDSGRGFLTSIDGRPFVSSSDNRFVVYYRLIGYRRSNPIWVDTRTGATKVLPKTIRLGGVSDDGKSVLYTPLGQTRCCESYRNQPVIVDVASGAVTTLPTLPRIDETYAPYLSAILASDGQSAFVAQEESQYIASSNSASLVSRFSSWDRATGQLTEVPIGSRTADGSINQPASLSAHGLIAYTVTCGAPDSMGNQGYCPVVWNPKTGAVLRPPSVGSKVTTINDVALSADGRHLAWTDRDFLNYPFTSTRVFTWKVGDSAVRLVHPAGPRDRSAADLRVAISDNGTLTYLRSANRQRAIWLLGPRSTKPRFIAEVAESGGLAADARSILFASKEQLVPQDRDGSQDLYLYKR